MHFRIEKWLKVAPWVLLIGGWLLLACLLTCSADFAYEQAFLQLGPEKIVGTHNVFYQEAPGYIYTNPAAMARLHFRCLASHFGGTLLFAALATALLWSYEVLSQRKIWARMLRIFFWGVMALLLLYLALICVWEWGLAWLALLLAIRFLPYLSIKSRYTAMALISALALLGWQRTTLKIVSRRYDAFWNLAEQCVTKEQFAKAFGDPVMICTCISNADKEWFDKLAPFDASLWHPGKTLAGFVSPQMPGILLLPWFDDDNHRIAFAWCDLTPERQALLAKKREAPQKPEDHGE